MSTPDADALPGRMLQVSRLATIGEMAAGAAHELNQPLTAIANYGGTGLGLAISNTVVRAHGGFLGHKPNLPHGACFHIQLPTEPAG